MDYGFSKAFIDYVNGTEELKGNFKSVGQYLPDTTQYPALLMFTEGIHVLDQIIPGQEKVKIPFHMKVMSGYSGLQELYFLGSLIDKHFNDQALETDTGCFVHLRLESPTFEGVQKTKMRNYRSMTIKGTGYLNL